MKKIIATVVVSLGFLAGCSTSPAMPDQAQQGAQENKQENKQKKNRIQLKNGKVVYPFMEVEITTADGKVTPFTSDKDGWIELPDGEMWDPKKFK